MPAALDLALAVEFTVYVSLHLALVIAADVKLVTADKELVKLAGKSSFSDQIVLLNDKIQIKPPKNTYCVPKLILIVSRN